VSPYVEFHQWLSRVLTLNLTSGNAVGGHRPIVSIDGRGYLVIWGGVPGEILADRRVHVNVHVEADYIVTRVASMLLPAADRSPTFRYETRYTPGLGAPTEQA